MTIADELRLLADRLPDTEAGLCTTAAWGLDHLTLDMAKAKGQSEDVVRNYYGLDAGRTGADTHPAPLVAPGAVSADVGADSRPVRQAVSDTTSNGRP